jgi:hypothetical protein
LAQISSGQLRAGQKLGAERDLASEYQVSRSTLRLALTALEETGVVRRLPGRGGGTFISPEKIDRDLSQIVGVPSLLRGQGFTAGTRLISSAVMPADAKTRQALGLTEGEIKENEDMWREEREDPELKVAGSDLRAVGISPGAMQTDIETGEEIAQMEPAGVGTPAVALTGTHINGLTQNHVPSLTTPR